MIMRISIAYGIYGGGNLMLVKAALSSSQILLFSFKFPLPSSIQLIMWLMSHEILVLGLSCVVLLEKPLKTRSLFVFIYKYIFIPCVLITYTYSVCVYFQNFLPFDLILD